MTAFPYLQPWPMKAGPDISTRTFMNTPAGLIRYGIFLILEAIQKDGLPMWNGFPMLTQLKIQRRRSLCPPTALSLWDFMPGRMWGFIMKGGLLKIQRLSLPDTALQIRILCIRFIRLSFRILGITLNITLELQKSSN